ncbi:MAG: hypothetical protein IKT33_00355 [Clostridia bacterium]|nr:hypothetical protein [Clostridia bacterium]
MMNQSNQPLSNRVQADERLDGLFMTEMRCPYCQTKMPKATSKCKNCGLTKEQIYHAELTAPYKPGREVLFSKVRPAVMPYWKMVLGSLFGFFGVHNFIAKRYLRGAIMLLLTVAYLVSLIIFPPMLGEAEPNAIRYLFESQTYLFPGDLLGIFALTMWIWDFFAVVFGQYKYPVLPKIEEE